MIDTTNLSVCLHELCTRTLYSTECLAAVFKVTKVENMLSRTRLKVVLE